MILIAGGTGTLGRLSIPHLLKRGQSVRVLTREPARAQDVQTAGVEIVEGDVLDVASLQRAMVGVVNASDARVASWDRDMRTLGNVESERKAKDEGRQTWRCRHALQEGDRRQSRQRRLISLRMAAL